MARPSLGDSSTERLHLKITADEIAAIDDFRYANRVPSRSEAVRRLVQIGLALENGTDEINRTGNLLSDRIEAVDKAIAKAVADHESMKRQEIIQLQAKTFVEIYHSMHKAVEEFLDAVAAVSLQQFEFRYEKSLSSAMEKSIETRLRFSDPNDDGDDK